MTGIAGSAPSGPRPVAAAGQILIAGAVTARPGRDSETRTPPRTSSSRRRPA